MFAKMKSKKAIIYLVLILFALFFLLPMYVLIITSFKSFAEVSVKTMWDLPQQMSLNGFITALNKLAPNLLNSFYLVIPATLISAMLGSINGYVLSHWKFKGADTLFAVLLFG
ncbi:MAG TPA: carbohydrate ABC transporter permease, partial [Halanaerobiales bacterium]|nr:carbohydrate ABC transporter permease [Halanaerobiales bacterium]